jgi:transposase
MDERKKDENISLEKIKEILIDKYNIKISKSTIRRILRNKLHFRYRKTMIKNHELDSIKYKTISFIFIKIIIRAMLMNLNFIFIDESKFSLINNNYKTWTNKNDNLHYGPKKKDKINIILGVSTNEVIYYELIKDNINKNNFLNFMKNMINKINKDDLNNYVFIMDNMSAHCCKKVKNYFYKKKLKILYTVPYESSFNPIELCFRYMKNYIYKKIYLNLEDLKKDIINLLNSNEIKVCLLKNFVETLGKYYHFSNSHILLDFEKSEDSNNK